MAARSDVAAVVLTGGPTVFAAGTDVAELARWSHAECVRRSREVQDAAGAVARIPQPTVAAVAGMAIGAGCALALCCDRRIAGDNARLGFPEILLGIFPGGGGTQRAARLIGPSRTKDLIYTGRMVKADEALAIGLVDEVVPADEVYTRAVAWAKQFTAGPALAYAAAKAAIDNGLDTDLRTGLDIESALFAGVFATDDAKAGTASFVENGPGKATFTGR